VRKLGHRGSAPIERQLHTFLQNQIREWFPDLIVVIERKGTAILRALKEGAESFEWPWSKVVSSDIIEQVSNEFFENKRVLIFDDTMNTGYHLNELLTNFSKRGLGDKVKIRVAVFAVHESSFSGFPFQGEIVPHAWFYRSLTTTSYQAINAQIVRMLQQAGSLMLDTEHVEVRLRLHGSFSKFVEALQRNSDAIVFRSAGGRTNITVLYNDDEAHSLPADRLPSNTLCSKIVKKCRIVQRSTDEFAIIPICFPSVTEKMEEWSLSRSDQAMLGSNAKADYKTRFYDVGLIAALEVLRWALKDLAIWGVDNYTLSLPQRLDDRASNDGYDLEHLRAMYPALDIGCLTDRIAEVERIAASEGNALRAYRFESRKTPVYTDQELRRDALCLLSAMRLIADQRTVEKGVRYGWENSNSFHWEGLTLGEIYGLGEDLNWTDDRITTLFDILIDEATLSTDIAPFYCPDGVTRIVRTFSPAGEIVSELVRRYTTQWGLPHGL
jgi:hypothetical protein